MTTEKPTPVGAMQAAQVPYDNDQVDADLAARLRQARQELKKTQNEMAELVGAGLSTWQSYERGTSPPKIQALTKLASVGFSADWLLTGEGEPFGGSDESPAPNGSPIDRELLQEILAALEAELDQRSLSLVPEKKSAAVALLYSHFRQLGRIDKESVNAVLQLVA